jgi:predicted outer membrane protein
MTDKTPEEFPDLTEEEEKKAKDTLRKSFDELSDEEKNSLAKEIAQILRNTLADGKLEAMLTQVVQGIQKNPEAFKEQLEKKVK